MVDKEDVKNIIDVLQEYIDSIEASGYECYLPKAKMPICRCYSGSLCMPSSECVCIPSENNCIPFVAASRAD